jgi:site-specific DNA-methyltransferase (adenine-specific)
MSLWSGLMSLLKTIRMKITNEDNMELMARYPDNYFDLAIVDPPYGIGFGDYERGSQGVKTKERHTKNGKKKWDNTIPNQEYFNELKRVSKNQIIWGGNYFPLEPTQCFIFWYKQNPVANFSDGELAWTSFKKPALCFDYRYYGNLSGKTSAETKTHPTQKPIELYKFCLDKLAKPNDKILDTHLGSGSIAIACHDYGFDLTACELDKEYFDKAMQRINNHVAQQKLF